MKKNGSLIAAIIWAVCAVLWLIVTIFRIADGDSAWVIAINLIVFALSVVNVILNYRNYKKENQNTDET